MSLFYSLGTFEILLLVVFGVMYLLYVLKVIGAAKQLNSGYSKVFMKLILRTAYFLLCLFALLGPSFGQQEKDIKAIGKDIYMAVDLSESMNASDVQPTRLEKIKFELARVVESFNSDRISIIIFSNEAFVQCPLTFDQGILRTWIESLSTRLVPNSGTDFGAPLRMVINKIENETQNGSAPKAKIILLISDGEDFGDSTDEALKDIEEKGIQLFTLGIGTERGSKIPTSYGFKRNKSGEEVVTKLENSSLKNMASKTGGKYFEINENQNDIDRLINTIELVEGEVRDVRKLDVTTNKFYYFLGLALILMAFDAMFVVKLFRL